MFGKPVISGPSIHNFKDIYSIIKKAQAGFIVSNKNELLYIVEKLLGDKEYYTQTAVKCEKVFAEQQGALDFVINIAKSIFYKP